MGGSSVDYGGGFGLPDLSFDMPDLDFSLPNISIPQGIDWRKFLRFGNDLPAGTPSIQPTDIDSGLRGFESRVIPNLHAASGNHLYNSMDWLSNLMGIENTATNPQGPGVPTAEEIAATGITGAGAGAAFGANFPPPPMPTYAGADEAGQTYAEKQQQWYQERQRAVDDAVAAVAGQYSGALDELRGRLAAYQVGDRDVQAAYKDFQGDIERIGVGVEAAEGLDDTAVVEAVETSYDQAEGVLGEAFAAIDASGNGGMSNALQAEMRTFEDVITDSLRTDLASMENLHGLSSDYALALAGFAYADDKYQAENQRMLLKAQFDKEIKDQKDAIARTQAEMNAAMERARSSAELQFGEFNMDQPTLKYETFNDFAMNQGMNQEETDASWAVVNNIMDNYGERIVTASDFRNYTNQHINSQNFMKWGLDLQLQAWIDEAATADDDEQVLVRQAAVQRLLEADWSSAIRGDGAESKRFTEELAKMGGIDMRPMFQKAYDNPQEFDSMKEQGILLDGWSIWNKVENDWDDIQGVGKSYFTDGQLSKAPSGFTFPTVGNNWRQPNSTPFSEIQPSGRVQQGVNIGGVEGGPVVSTTPGTVEGVGWSDTYGFYIRVRDDTTGFLHKYTHLQTRPIFRADDKVIAGQQVGEIGHTGTDSSGESYLHYEIWDPRTGSIDPSRFLAPTNGWQS